MKRPIKHISEYYGKQHFWDVRTELLEIDRDKAFIIPRALFYTSKETFEEDIEKLERIYLKEDILYFIQNTTEMIGNDVSIGVAKRYNAPVILRWKESDPTERNVKRANRMFGDSL